MDDLLPGMLHLARDGGETLTRQLTDQLRGLITERPPRARPAPAVEPCSLRNRSACRATPPRLRSSNWPRKAMSPFPPAAVRSWPRACRSIAARAHREAAAAEARGYACRPGRRSLQRSIWPPIHDGRPRPFQPGLADEREFPHDDVEPLPAARGAERTATPRPPHQPSAAAGSLAQASRGSSRDQGRSQPDPVRAARRKPAWRWSPMRCSNRAITPGSKARATAAPTSHFRPPAPSSPPSRSTQQGMAISSHKEAPRLIFVTPSHQYPTGRLMPIGRRLELLRFAEAAGACIIEDDYDGEFHYEARPVAALQGLAPSPRVFYLGTFSKATYADIRIGYVVVPEALIDVFELAQRHMGILTSITMQDALAEFISAGAYLGHIRRMTRLYKARRDRMLQALAAEAGNRLTRRDPSRRHAIAGKVHAPDQRPATVGAAARGRRRQPGADRACCITGPKSSGLFLGFAAWNDKGDRPGRAHTWGGSCAKRTLIASADRPPDIPLACARPSRRRTTPPSRPRSECPALQISFQRFGRFSRAPMSMSLPISIAPRCGRLSGSRPAASIDGPQHVGLQAR